MKPEASIDTRDDEYTTEAEAAVLGSDTAGRRTYIHRLPFSGCRLLVRATGTECGESLGRIKYELLNTSRSVDSSVSLLRVTSAIRPALPRHQPRLTRRRRHPAAASHRPHASKPHRCIRCMLTTRHSNIGIHMPHHSDVTRRDGIYFRRMAGRSAPLVVVCAKSE